MPTLRPQTTRHLPGRYAESESIDVDIRMQSSSKNGDHASRPSTFIPELSQTCAFPMRALNDPRRHPNEALADYHKAAARILHESLSLSSSSSSSSSSLSATASAQKANDKKELFLTRTIDAAREQLECDFARWRRRLLKKRLLQKQLRAEEKEKKEKEEKEEHEEKKRDNERPLKGILKTSTSSENQKKRKHEGDASERPDKKKTEKGGKSDKTENQERTERAERTERTERQESAGQDAHPPASSSIVVDGSDEDGSDSYFGALYISDDESEDLETASPAIIPELPGTATWDEVPDNMKLIIIKEMTTWYTYDHAVAMLSLTHSQDFTFRSLYIDEQKKAALYAQALREYQESCMFDREVQRYLATSRRAYEALHGWTRAVPASEGVAGSPAKHLPDLENPIQYIDAFIRPEIADPGLLTDYVSIRQMQTAYCYLAGVGCKLDLSHWLGHSTGGRFEIVAMAPIVSALNQVKSKVDAGFSVGTGSRSQMAVLMQPLITNHECNKRHGEPDLRPAPTASRVDRSSGGSGKGGSSGKSVKGGKGGKIGRGGKSRKSGTVPGDTSTAQPAPKRAYHKKTAQKTVASASGSGSGSGAGAGTGTTTPARVGRPSTRGGRGGRGGGVRGGSTRGGRGGRKPAEARQVGSARSREAGTASTITASSTASESAEVGEQVTVRTDKGKEKEQ